MSDEEVARQIAPGGLLDPATLSDSDLETLLDELDRLQSDQTG
jgi:hypothetical protein